MDQAVASSNPGKVYLSYYFIPQGFDKISTASMGRNSGAALTINKGADGKTQLRRV